MAARELDLAIEGMTCGACAARLEQALRLAPGVLTADVNLALERAAVSIEDDLTDAAMLTEVVAHSGFDVRTEARTFQVEGMTCAACAARVESALRQVPGVVDADVNLTLERATVTVLPGLAGTAALVEQVRRGGYELIAEAPADAEAERRQAADEQRRLTAERRAVVIAGCLTTPMVVGMLFTVLGYDQVHLMPAAEVLLATPIQFVIGARFYQGAWRALRGGGANMDVLVAMGTSAAYFYSWYLLIALGEAAEGALYFEASAVIITLVLLGKYLESRAKRATTGAIRQLMDLRPATARVRQPDGSQRELPVAQVARDDVVLIRPGERVPVDGLVVDGGSDVDESLLTGEGVPVAKRPGAAVTGGAINITGYLEVRASAAGGEGTLARIIRLVEDAQRGKAAVQRLVDRVSRIFVPIVTVIALLTLIAWLVVGGGFEASLIAAVAVLVIACPCALGLATPTAIMVGTGAAARAGILIKNVNTLERVPGLSTAIFDKTGTLTMGNPVVVEVRVQRGDADELLRLAAGVQQASEHPLARAVVAKARERGLEPPLVSEFRNYIGVGVSGLVAGVRIRIGNREFVGGVPDADWGEPARTVVWVADDEGVRGALAFSDPLRPGAKPAIDRLRAMGIGSLILSGDAPPVVEALAAQIGIDAAEGGVRPERKAELVRERAARGERVAMIGDGVNDAPALAAAEVGIAMGSGADIAMETADITLMRPDPGLIPAAISVSRATLRKIQQNLFWAFIYNLIGIPAAALGYLSPTLAGAAMAFSSVCVVTNSLLLRNWKPGPDG